MGLVGDAKAEGGAQEGRAASGGEEEDEAVDQSFHETVLSGKFRPAVCQETDREGGGYLLPFDQYIETGRTVAEVLRSYS